ncbi:hypothetical protein HD554DRAFT_2041925 [Boletus coccyginus]|nr:hypothetical protein HD554DRAFT_2041925 [Boletus coccyginus]
MFKFKCRSFKSSRKLAVPPASDVGGCSCPATRMSLLLSITDQVNLTVCHGEQHQSSVHRRLEFGGAVSTTPMVDYVSKEPEYPGKFTTWHAFLIPVPNYGIQYLKRKRDEDLSDLPPTKRALTPVQDINPRGVDSSLPAELPVTALQTNTPLKWKRDKGPSDLPPAKHAVTHVQSINPGGDIILTTRSPITALQATLCQPLKWKRDEDPPELPPAKCAITRVQNVNTSISNYACEAGGDDSLPPTKPSVNTLQETNLVGRPTLFAAELLIPVPALEAEEG